MAHLYSFQRVPNYNRVVTNSFTIFFYIWKTVFLDINLLYFTLLTYHYIPTYTINIKVNKLLLMYIKL